MKKAVSFVGRVEKAVETVAEAAEKAAEMAEKVATEVADSMPENSILKKEALVIEQLARVVKKDAVIVEELVLKVISINYFSITISVVLMKHILILDIEVYF